MKIVDDSLMLLFKIQLDDRCRLFFLLGSISKLSLTAMSESISTLVFSVGAMVGKGVRGMVVVGGVEVGIGTSVVPGFML